MKGGLPAVGEQTKVFVVIKSWYPKIVPDDEDRNFAICGNRDWSANLFTDVDAVGALVPGKPKSGVKKHSFKCLRIDRRKPRDDSLHANSYFAALDGNPVWTYPSIPITAPIARFFEHLFESSHLGASRNKAADSLINCAPCFVGRRAQ